MISKSKILLYDHLAAQERNFSASFEECFCHAMVHQTNVVEA